MKQAIFVGIIGICMSAHSYAQTYLDSTINSSTKKVLFSDPNAFAIGSYGEAHYNHDINPGKLEKGNMDLHRIIMFMGYKFNSKLQFFTEIEFEHTDELAVEQAFINYSFNSFFNFKAGVILIPMGYVNEFHEPTLFNGVERPFVDTYIIPSTWREMGAGFHGLVKKANIKYQLYAVNGFTSYSNGATLTGSTGLRPARQNGSKAMFGAPSITGKVSYFGLNGLRFGISGFFGNTESTLHDGLDRNEAIAISHADSSVVGINMVGFNAMYNYKGFQFTAVGSYTNISNTEEYNTLTGSNVGAEIMGWYGEIAYRHKIKTGKEYPQLIPFVRYENYNTHQAVDRTVTTNLSYNKRILTSGIGLQLTPGTIFKIDYQILDHMAELTNGSKAFVHDKNILNIGFGYWF